MVIDGEGCQSRDIYAEFVAFGYGGRQLGIEPVYAFDEYDAVGAQRYFVAFVFACSGGEVVGWEADLFAVKQVLEVAVEGGQIQGI